jgi:hypothetical protein
MVGAGIVISFFNSLDFNIIGVFPISKKGNSARGGFFGFGFDFPLTEYNKRLSKRNRDMNNKQLIAEASGAAKSN